jgi:hypothetical protein
MALANVSLDLIGQARLLYQRWPRRPLQGGDATEDTLAYFRDPHEFRNYTLLELPHHGPLAGYAAGRPRLRHHHRAQLPVQRADGAGVGRPAAVRRRAAWPPSPPSRSRSALPPAPFARLAGAPGRRHRRIARPRAGGADHLLPYTEEFWTTSPAEGAAARPRSASTCGRCAPPGTPGERRAGRGHADPPELPRLRHRGQAACTPSTWASCWPRCRAWPAPTRAPPGKPMSNSAPASWTRSGPRSSP